MNHDHQYIIGELLEEILTELKEVNSKLTTAEEVKDMKRRLDEIEKKDVVLSVAEAALFTGKSGPTIRTYIRKGKLTRVIRGCKEGVLKSELESFKKI